MAEAVVVGLIGAVGAIIGSILTVIIPRMLDAHQANYKEHRRVMLTIHEKLPYDELSKRAGDSKEFRILTTWTPTFIERYKRELSEAIHKKSTLRVLLLNPRANDISVRRSRELDQSDESGEQAIVRTLKALEWIRANSAGGKGQIYVRLYSQLPSVAAYWSDDTVFFGLFLKGERVVNTPAFEVSAKKHSLIFEALDKEFRKVWNSSMKVTDVLPEFSEFQSLDAGPSYSSIL